MFSLNDASVFCIRWCMNTVKLWSEPKADIKLGSLYIFLNFSEGCILKWFHLFITKKSMTVTKKMFFFSFQKNQTTSFTDSIFSTNIHKQNKTNPNFPHFNFFIFSSMSPPPPKPSSRRTYFLPRRVIFSPVYPYLHCALSLWDSPIEEARALFWHAILDISHGRVCSYTTTVGIHFFINRWVLPVLFLFPL